MHRLLRIQLEKVYGKNLHTTCKDEKFQKFIELVEDAYLGLEHDRDLLDRVLEVNAKELNDTNEKLKEQHEFLTNVTNSLSDVIFYKDLNHKYIGCNKIFEDFMGLSKEEIIGKTDYDFFNKESADTFYQKNEIILKDRVPLSYKHWVEYKGEKVYVLTVKSPLMSKNGDLIGIVGISRDITKEHNLEQELELQNILLLQQNRLASMGEMISYIAHQWRQPLNAIYLLIQKIGIYNKLGKLDETKLNNTVEKSMYVLDKMSETIEDFRDFFNTSKEKSAFDIVLAIHKSYSIIEPIFNENIIKFIFNVEDTFIVKGYQNEFSQVILNILNNSREVLRKKKILNPFVSIDVKKVNNQIIITINDNAGGIDEKKLKSIFDPYFTTKKDSNTGIGLYMSKRIIESRMKGKLNAYNTDKGLCFEIICKTLD